MSELAKKLAEEFADKDYAHSYTNEYDDMMLAAQLKVLREAMGLTQEQLAVAAGMKQASISRLEQADYSARSISTLRRLAEVFDVAVHVSFQPFSKSILDIVNLRKERLLVKNREADLARMGRMNIAVGSDGEWAVMTKTAPRAQSQPVDGTSKSWQNVGEVTYCITATARPL